MSESPPPRKDRWLLIAGVSLPLLVVVFFLAARFLPRLWVDPPRYEILYAVSSGSDYAPKDWQVSVSVVEGKLRARWTKLEEPRYAPLPKVYRFDAAAGLTHRVEIPEAPADASSPHDTFVDVLGTARIQTDPVAPDGYQFKSESGRSGGFLNEIFIGGSSYDTKVTLRKGGRIISVPRLDEDRYFGVEFLGWIVPSESR